MLNGERKYWTSLWYLIDRIPSFNSLVRIVFLLLYPSLGSLVLPPLFDEVPVCFPWSSGFWNTHWTLPEQCYLHHQYSFLSLVLFLVPPFGSSSIQGERSLMWVGYPLVDSMLDVLDFSDNFLKSSTIVWFTPTRDRIWASFGSLLDHLPETRGLLYFLRAVSLNCYSVNSLSSSHSLLLVSMWSLNSGNDKVEYRFNCWLIIY